MGEEKKPSMRYSDFRLRDLHGGVMTSDKTYEIRPALLPDVTELATLFDAYRMFYGAASELSKADAFVHGLIAHGRNHFFLARESEGEPALGFVHLMPSINTVAMRPIWLLEDLYVVPAGRGKGVATALMTHAEEFARETGAERLTLATARDNRKAQSLYKHMGYLKEEHFWYYHRLLD
jgi:ribosomal protein S18 acetylase RimI-like enzyme